MAFAETLVVLSLLFKMDRHPHHLGIWERGLDQCIQTLPFWFWRAPPSQPEAHSYEDADGTFPSCLIFVHLREERSLQQRCQAISSLVTILAWRPCHSQIVNLICFERKTVGSGKFQAHSFYMLSFFLKNSLINFKKVVVSMELDSKYESTRNSMALE